MVFWFDWPFKISGGLNIIGLKTYVIPANTGGCNSVGGGGSSSGSSGGCNRVGSGGNSSSGGNEESGPYSIILTTTIYMQITNEIK